MREALVAYLERSARGGNHRASVLAAARAVASNPWDVVSQAGKLARARPLIAEQDLGLTADLRPVAVDGRQAVVRIEQGQTYPGWDGTGRRKRGAYDTPRDLARRVVHAASSAVDGELRTGLDTACGTGAFLVAMAEAGVPEIFGTDLDEVALAVARIACPRARLLCDDALKHGVEVDLVCGNPPFVPPERQDRRLRDELRRRFPWLRGRFDLVVPFAATAAQRARAGGGVGLVLPFPALVQPYGSVLRRRWVQRHRLTVLQGPQPFPGASVHIGVVVMRVGAGPGPVPAHGIAADELLRLETVPLSPVLRPGDVDLSEAMRACSEQLGELCLVDTGLVAHGPDGGKARLISDEPGEGRVPYADAREFFAGTHRWLAYEPQGMHRPKSPTLFESPKLVVQRIRGQGPVRAAVDREGIYVGHTCTVVLPRDPRIELEHLLELIQSPLIDGLIRIERGQRLDLYPRDVSAIPLPQAWLSDPSVGLAEAFGLRAGQVRRLEQIAAASRSPGQA